jgi:Tetracyclin repressor-like, C-terminal domain
MRYWNSLRIANPIFAGRTRPLKPADILEFPATGWDKRIAADLTAEMERHLAEKVSTIPEMRRFLAVKGYRELRQLIQHDVAGKSGADALRAAMISMRRYALERPGMSAATFRNPETDSPEWRSEQMELGKVLFAIFAQLGIRGEQAQHALRILRSFVRGFVLHEMGASFLEPLEHDQTYELGIRLFIEGLNALRN